MPYKYTHQLNNYLIRHNFNELDVYIASHPDEMFKYLGVKTIREIDRFDALFFEKIVGYDKRRRRAFICINMLMVDNNLNMHRVIREGIQEADTFMAISREDTIAESFMLATTYCQQIGFPVAFGNRSHN
jgi:hypothetical protein